MPIPKTFINTNPNNLTLAEIREKNYRNGYEMAIDDFVKACKENIMYKTFGLRECDIEQIAEQLEAGDNNDQV